MRNVYSVKLAKGVVVESGPYSEPARTTWVYAVASSIAKAEEAVLRKYPRRADCGVEVLNDTGLPVVLGD